MASRSEPCDLARGALRGAVLRWALCLTLGVAPACSEAAPSAGDAVSAADSEPDSASDSGAGGDDAGTGVDGHSSDADPGLDGEIADADGSEGGDADVDADVDADAAPEADVSPDADDTDPGPAPACAPWPKTLPSVDDPLDPGLPAGLAAGAVRPTSATVVVATEGADTLTVHVSAGPDCAPSLAGPFASTAATGFVVQVPLEDLLPGTRYRYRVELASTGELSAPGWLTTPPVADVPMRLMVSGDVGDNPAYGEVIDDAVLAAADVFLSLGDWPYADASPAAVSLAEYRDKHRGHRASAPIQALLRSTAMLGTWDDHEIVNDWDGADSASQPERVAAGIQAWREYFPLADAPPGEIYRRHLWGPNVELFWLDTRSHRDANADPDGPDKTMLGAAQLSWLLDGLSDSQAAFKLVLTSVPLDFTTTNDDAWDGFVWERELIVEHILEQQIGGVIFLTADQHWLAVHHFQTGLKAFQTGALAQFTRTPSDDVPPWVLLQQEVRNFGLLDYQPGPPPTLVFSAWGDQGAQLYTETITAGVGTIEIAPPSPESAWTLTGAHTFFGQGPATLPWATPGAYTIMWGPGAPNEPVPPGETLSLEDGGTLGFAAGEAPAPLLLEPFDGPGLPVGWQVVDQGVDDATSDWQVWAGAAVESGNCYDFNEGEAVVEKRGTFLWRPDLSIGDGLITAQLRWGDNDGMGVMYGVQGEETYYRFSADHQRSFARLVRVEGGAFTVLAEDLDYAPPLGAWTTLAIEREGAQHRVWLGGELVLEASDGALGAGSLALYCYGQDDGRFAQIGVWPLAAD